MIDKIEKLIEKLMAPLAAEFARLPVAAYRSLLPIF